MSFVVIFNILCTMDTQLCLHTSNSGTTIFSTGYENIP